MHLAQAYEAYTTFYVKGPSISNKNSLVFRVWSEIDKDFLFVYLKSRTDNDSVALKSVNKL